MSIVKAKIYPIDVSIVNIRLTVKVKKIDCFVSEEKPESGLDGVDSRLDNIGGRITALYSKMCWELGADLQV